MLCGGWWLPGCHLHAQAPDYRVNVDSRGEWDPMHNYTMNVDAMLQGTVLIVVDIFYRKQS
jgi:hypothetical protein